MRLPVSPPRQINSKMKNSKGKNNLAEPRHFLLFHFDFCIVLRRRADSNRRIKVLQTCPLPLGYGAKIIKNEKCKNKKEGLYARKEEEFSSTFSFFIFTFALIERETGFEPATFTLAR